MIFLFYENIEVVNRVESFIFFFFKNVFCKFCKNLISDLCLCVFLYLIVCCIFWVIIFLYWVFIVLVNVLKFLVMYLMYV